MSAADLADGVQALAAAVLAAADDPRDQARLLARLAVLPAPPTAGNGLLAQAIDAAAAAGAALCRRAALAALGRACAASAPPTADAALALRDLACELMANEELTAADAGDAGAAAALRALRLAVFDDLTGRALALPKLKQVQTPAALPAVVQAARLYGDGSRADELIALADPENPLFMPLRFLAPSD